MRTLIYGKTDFSIQFKPFSKLLFANFTDFQLRKGDWVEVRKGFPVEQVDVVHYSLTGNFQVAFIDSSGVEYPEIKEHLIPLEFKNLKYGS